MSLVEDGESDSDEEFGDELLISPSPVAKRSSKRELSSPPLMSVETIHGKNVESEQRRPSLGDIGKESAFETSWDVVEMDHSPRSSLAPSPYGSHGESSRDPSPRPSTLLVEPPSQGLLMRRMTVAIDEWYSQHRHSIDELSNVSGDEPADEFERKLLYLMVARCIAYPFNAKQQLDTSPPRTKLTRESFDQIYVILQACLNQDLGLIRRKVFPLSEHELRCIQDIDFLSCLQSYMDYALQRDDVIFMCNNGGFSVKELEAIYSVLAVKHLMSQSPTRVVDPGKLYQWESTFKKLVLQASRLSPVEPITPMSATGVPSQDSLFDLFQKILGVQSIEHKILFRECQLGNVAEQEAVARKELQKKIQRLEFNRSMHLGGHLGSHKIEDIYREEQLRFLRQLSTNLDNLALAGTGVISPLAHRKRGAHVTKHDLVFQYDPTVVVTVHEVFQISKGTVAEGKAVFCVFEMVDGDNTLSTTPLVPTRGSAKFNRAGEFTVHCPLPEIRFSLRTQSSSLFSDDKILAKPKHVHTVTPTTSETHETIELYRNEKDTTPAAKLKISVVFEAPSNVKKWGYMHSSGDNIFKQWQQRFFVLIQHPSYKFILCTFRPKESHPHEYIVLEGFNVDIMDDTPMQSPSHSLRSNEEGKFKFGLVSETVKIQFGCRDSREKQRWIEWLTRATGQESAPQQGETASCGTDLERHGLSDVVCTEISEVDPHRLFVQLLNIMLKYRFKEPAFSRGLLSTAQLYVLDEFCARYGVRDSLRHLTCLREWLDWERKGVATWPVMMLSSFRFCQMHIAGINPPAKAVIVTREEQESLTQLSQQIEEMVLYKVENFRTCFPFGCPKDDLKVTIKLYNLVSPMNHTSDSTSSDYPLTVLTIAMERAALNNYKQVFSALEAAVEGAPLSMEQLIELVHLCVQFMYELHDFYWEDFSPVGAVFTSHIDAFWSFFLVDLKEGMSACTDSIAKLRLFHLVNQYFCSQPTMKLGVFHRSFLNEFTPVVVHYIDTLEASLRSDLARSFAAETWLPVSLESCAVVREAVRALQSLKVFLEELSWPEETFALHLEQRRRGICMDRFQEATDYTHLQLQDLLGSGTMKITYKLPSEVFTMLNTLVFLNQNVMQLCSPQSTTTAPPSDIESRLSNVLHSAIALIVDKLCSPLSLLLTKLSKYDTSDTFLASLKKLVPTRIPIASYEQFLKVNVQEIFQHLVPTIFSNFIVNWYECQLLLVNQWLTKRPQFSLHMEQQHSINSVMKAIHEHFQGYDIPEEQLESETFLDIQDRLRIENSRTDLLDSMGTS